MFELFPGSSYYSNYSRLRSVRLNKVVNIIFIFKVAKLPRIMQSTVKHGKTVLLNCLIQFMFNTPTNGALHYVFRLVISYS